MAMNFGFTKWNRGLTSGQPMDSPLLDCGSVKNSPKLCELDKKIVHVLWLELCGIVMSSSKLICMLVD